jgi:hypothetical protein
MYDYVRTSRCYFTPVEYFTTYPIYFISPLYRTQNCIETKAVATAEYNKNLLGNSPGVLEWNLSTSETDSFAVFVDMVSAVFILEEETVREELEIYCTVNSTLGLSANLYPLDS